MEIGLQGQQQERTTVPVEWKFVRLRDECQVISKGTTPTSLGRQYTSTGIPFIKAESISQQADIVPSKLAFIDEETHAVLARSQLAAGDILFSIAGVLGRLYVVDSSDVPANTNQALAFIRLANSSDLDRTYLAYYLAGSEIRRHIEAINVQAAQANLSLKDVGNFLVAVPPLPEQRAIAAALSDVDALIAKLDALIAKKRAIKKAAMQRLLSGEQRLPGFSGPWHVRQLGEIADIRTGGKDNQDKVDGGPYPFFVRSLTVERINSYSYDGEAILVPGEGNIGSIFHYIDGKFEYHQRVYKISDFVGDVSGRYVYYFMTEHFGEQATRNSVKATVDSLRLPTFKNFEVNLPIFEEQRAIAEVLSNMDAEIEALQARRDKTQAIKQGMMQELLTGKTRLV